MPDFNIDRLKQQWQEQKVPNKYDHDEILQILNKKSRNYVKYILWISIAEFLIFVFANVYYLFEKQDQNSFIHILQRMGLEKTEVLQNQYSGIYLVMKIISLLVTGFFVVKFFITFKKIKVEENLKQFIIQIISFRKIVSIFILTNIIMLLVFMGILTWFVFHALTTQNIELDYPTLIGFISGITVSTLISIFLIWLYYRIVYGIIIGKLGRNLHQLQEIEKETT